MTLIHLEPEEFVQTMYFQGGSLKIRTVAMDNGVGGLVYMFAGKDCNIYYLDRLFTGVDLQMSEANRHAELYRKVALLSQQAFA